MRLGDVWTIAIRGQAFYRHGLSLHAVVNAWSYELLSGGYPANWPFDLATTFDGVVWAALAPLLHIDHTGGPYALYSSPKVLPPFLDPFFPARACTAPGERLPLYVAVRATLRSDQAGRHYRGSKLLGPVPLSAADGDDLSAAAQQQWEQAAATFAEDLHTGGGQWWRPVILSRDLSAVGEPNLYDGAAVTEAVVSRRLGFCRRRIRPQRQPTRELEHGNPPSGRARP